MTKKIALIFSLIIILLSASIIGCTKDTGTKTPVTGDGTPISTPSDRYTVTTATPDTGGKPDIFTGRTATPSYTGVTPDLNQGTSTLPAPPCITDEEWRRIAFKYISET